jgi:hypothetical protein
VTLQLQQATEEIGALRLQLSELQAAARRALAEKEQTQLELQEEVRFRENLEQEFKNDTERAIVSAERQLQRALADTHDRERRMVDLEAILKRSETDRSVLASELAQEQRARLESGATKLSRTRAQLELLEQAFQVHCCCCYF